MEKHDGLVASALPGTSWIRLFSLHSFRTTLLTWMFGKSYLKSLLFVSLQVIMKACSGIDYAEFASFLKIIAGNRMAFLNACSSGDSSDYPRHLSETLTTLGPYHAAFDLQRVAHIIECLLCNEDFKRLDHSALTLQPETMLQQIRDTIQSTRGQHLLYQE